MVHDVDIYIYGFVRNLVNVIYTIKLHISHHYMGFLKFNPMTFALLMQNFVSWTRGLAQLLARSVCVCDLIDDMF